MTVTRVPGFKAYGISAGIKANDKLDLAYIGSEDNQAVLCAGVFTQNKLCAAPVTLTKEHLKDTNNRLVGVIVNSGNANAATGDEGYKNAFAMAQETASALGVNANQIAVSSTGLIGYQLPIEKIQKAIPQVVGESTSQGGELASTAIMTTDTKEKAFFEEFVDSNGNQFCVGAIAKGAAMLQPNMATMLAYVTTDANVEFNVLQNALSKAAQNSFNKLTVDGAQSTNDTVLAFTSAKSEPIDSSSFEDSLMQACQSLAKQMCDDAEGSTHSVKITVTGAANDNEANKGARQVANCQLVKCSWFGNDPYWGRVASELGASGIEYDFTKLQISYGDIVVLKNGVSLIDDFSEEQMSEIRQYMKKRDLELNADLGVGSGQGWIWTNDLTYGYVEENMGTS